MSSNLPSFTKHFPILIVSRNQALKTKLYIKLTSEPYCFQNVMVSDKMRFLDFGLNIWDTSELDFEGIIKHTEGLPNQNLILIGRKLDPWSLTTLFKHGIVDYLEVGQNLDSSLIRGLLKHEDFYPKPNSSPLFQNFPAQIEGELLWELDFSNQRLNWNGPYQDRMGHSLSSINSNYQNLLSNMLPEDRDIFLQRQNQAILNKTKSNWVLDYRFRKGNGEIAKLQCNGIIFRNKEGKAIKAMGIVIERKNSVDNLKKNELFQKISKHPGSGIVVLSSKSKDENDYKIEYVNSQIEKLLGFSKLEIEDTFFQDVFRNSHKIKKLIQENGIGRLISYKPIQSLLYGPNGSHVELEDGYIEKTASDFTYVILSFIDITENIRITNEYKFFSRLNAQFSAKAGFKEKFNLILSQLIKFLDISIAEGYISNEANNKLIKISVKTKSNDLIHQFHTEDNFKNINYNIGLPGITWEKGELLIWEDISNNHSFIRSSLARKNNLSTGIGVPIFYEGSIQGVILLLSTAPKSHFHPHLKFLENLGLRLGSELKRLKLEFENHTLFNILPDLVCILNLDGLIHKNNDAFLNTLGYNNTDLKDRTFLQITHKDDQDFTRECLNKVRKLKSPVYFSNRLVHKNNSIHYFTWTLIYDINQNQIYAVSKDTTKQYELELQLKESNALAKMGQWEYNVQLDKMFWSPETREILEVPNHFTPTLDSLNQFYTFSSNKIIMNQLEKIFSGAKIEFNEVLRAITYNNQLKWIRIAGKAEYNNGECIKIYGSYKDIDEEIKNKKIITDYNTRYRLAMQATNMGVWELDLTTDNLIWDSSMYELFHMTEGNEFTATEMWKMRLHPDDLERIEGAIDYSKTNLDKLDVNFRIVISGGKIRYLKGIADLIFDDDKDTYKLVGITYDVTEDVESRILLERNYEEKENILRSITEGFIALDQNGSVVYWNSAASNILNIEGKDVLGTDLLQNFPETDSSKLFSHFKKAVKEGNPVVFREYLPKQNKYLKVTIYPSEKSISIFLFDETLQINKEEEVAFLKEIQHHVINSTNDLIWAVDKKLNLISGNISFSNLIKEITDNEITIGENITQLGNFDVFNNYVLNKWGYGFTKALQGNSTTMEFNFQKIDKRDYLIDFHPMERLLKESGDKEIFGVAVFARDITEHKKNIKTITTKQTQLKEIAWIQSHEVRAPLAKILGLSNAIQDYELPMEEIQEIISYIVDSSLELDKIIRKISERADYES